MVVGILQELPFALQGPIFLFLWAPGSLILSSPFVLPILAIDSRPAVILLTSCHSFCSTQGLLGILQLQVFVGFHVELVYTLTFLLLELIPERGLGEHPIRKVS